jgi:hypothetical protein
MAETQMISIGNTFSENAIRVRKSILSSSLLGVLSWMLMASNVGAASSMKSPDSEKAFVRSFYEWYLRTAIPNTAKLAWDTALHDKKSAFAPSLAKALSEDVRAKSACEELSGIDFDPFLDTQDPAARYEVGDVTKRGDRYYIVVHPVENGPINPDVTVEIAPVGNGYVFVDFIYPHGNSLMTILNSPRPKCAVPRNPTK